MVDTFVGDLKLMPVGRDGCDILRPFEILLRVHFARTV